MLRSSRCRKSHDAAGGGSGFRSFRSADRLATRAGSAWCPRSNARSLAGTQHDTAVQGTTDFAASESSDIAADIIQRFIEQHRNAVERVRALDERVAAGTIMTSPFIKVITYSVQDGWRLMFAHDRRHFEQARRVTVSPGFPGA